MADEVRLLHACDIIKLLSLFVPEKVILFLGRLLAAKELFFHAGLIALEERLVDCLGVQLGISILGWVS
jgi:hypothetical protein